MARPQRNTVDYFPFICQEGKKMFYIEQTYGNDGFATFVKLLRELALSENHYLNLSEPTTLMFLSAKCRVSKDVLEAIINDLVNLGKFNKMLWSENKIIWCESFIESISDAYSKRNNKCITFDGLLLLLVSLGVRKPSKLPSKEPVNTQSKVEYSKVEESKVNNIPPFSDFLIYAKEKEPTVNESALKNKYDAWIANDWKNGNDKPIKNWKSALLQTMPYIEKNKPIEPIVWQSKDHTAPNFKSVG